MEVMSVSNDDHWPIINGVLQTLDGTSILHESTDNEWNHCCEV